MKKNWRIKVLLESVKTFIMNLAPSLDPVDPPVSLQEASLSTCLSSGGIFGLAGPAWPAWAWIQEPGSGLTPCYINPCTCPADLS